MTRTRTAESLASRIGLCVVGAFLGAMFATSVVLWCMDQEARVISFTTSLVDADGELCDEESAVKSWSAFGLGGALLGGVLAFRITRPPRTTLPTPLTTS